MTYIKIIVILFFRKFFGKMWDPGLDILFGCLLIADAIIYSFK